MEMMIAVSVMAVIVMGGTMVFFRTLSSSGINQAQLNINASSNQVLNAIETNIQYQKVRSVTEAGNTYDRDDCVLAGKTGISVFGSELEVYDEFGTTTYSLEMDGKIGSTEDDKLISSNSAAISSPNLLIRSIRFDWFCIPGSADKLRITLVSNDKGLTSEIPDRLFSRDINMYNSL